MERPVVMAPGPVNAPVIMTESEVLEKRMLPTVVWVPVTKESAATAGWVGINNIPARRAGTKEGCASCEAPRGASRFNMRIRDLIIIDPFDLSLASVDHSIRAGHPKTPPGSKSNAYEARLLIFYWRTFPHHSEPPMIYVWREQVCRNF